jgi:hypothetical protein
VQVLSVADIVLVVARADVLRPDPALPARLTPSPGVHRVRLAELHLPSSSWTDGHDFAFDLVPDTERCLAVELERRVLGPKVAVDLVQV